VKGTATDLISNDAIRTQISGDLVDQLYGNVDVAAALQQRLPAGSQQLAAPIAGALRELANRAAVRLLERPRIQAVWIASVTAAHRQLLRLLNDRGTALRTQNGEVVLDLRPLLIQLGDQIAIVGNLASRLPPDAGQIAIMKSNDLRTAQRGTHLLDILGRFLWIVTLGLAALAVWLAAGRRRTTVRSLAIGLIVAGLLVLVIRRVVGHEVVNALSPPGSTSTSVSDAWNIFTGLLVDGGRTVVGIGLVALLGTWLTGGTRSALATRRELAPLLARWGIAYGAAAVFLLLLVWWGPTVQLRRPQAVLAMAILLALGTWALRRLTLSEHPDAGDEPASAPFSRMWAGVRGGSRQPGETA
jgi:hypothetical protein